MGWYSIAGHFPPSPSHPNIIFQVTQTIRWYSCPWVKQHNKMTPEESESPSLHSGCNGEGREERKGWGTGGYPFPINTCCAS